MILASPFRAIPAGSSKILRATHGAGINDDIEAGLGTDPLLADTDGDGSSDGDELISGTNPLDADSTPAPQPTTALLQLTALLTLLTIRRRHR